MNGAESLIETLKYLGADTVFGYPGGAIMPVYDALPGQLRHVLCRHEQGAAFAAQGYAKTTGRPGICLATSGPGATNLVTGIADAHMDSIPLLVITGQVETGLIGTNAFQEVDVISMTQKIVKASYQVTDPGAISDTIGKAYRTCTSGRPGPVLIDLPKDMQTANIAGFEPPAKAHVDSDTRQHATDDEVDMALTILLTAARPVIMAGGGIKISGASAMLRRLAEILQTPVVTTLNAIGCMPKDHYLNLGMLGMHGSEPANDAVQNADLIINIGARFDDRATGKASGFAPKAKVIHVDLDPSEFNKNIKADLTIHSDAGAFLAKALQGLGSDTTDSEHDRNADKTARSCRNVCALRPDADDAPIDAARLLDMLGEHLDHNTYVTVDVGQHQMWTAQHVSFTGPDQFLTSGGLGTMGFGLPAAIGVQIARPDAQVINITGDGSFMMNVQELATIRRYQLPIKVIVLNNQHLGLVRQQQELFYGERYSEVDLSDNPDFAALSAVFGFKTETIQRASETSTALDWLIDSAGPSLLEVQIPSAENVWPFVVPGQTNDVRLTRAI